MFNPMYTQELVEIILPHVQNIVGNCDHMAIHIFYGISFSAVHYSHILVLLSLFWIGELSLIHVCLCTIL
jgi:hypothetical protein